MSTTVKNSSSSSSSSSDLEMDSVGLANWSLQTLAFLTFFSNNFTPLLSSSDLVLRILIQPNPHLFHPCLTHRHLPLLPPPPPPPPPLPVRTSSTKVIECLGRNAPSHWAMAASFVAAPSGSPVSVFFCCAVLLFSCCQSSLPYHPATVTGPFLFSFFLSFLFFFLNYRTVLALMTTDAIQSVSLS